MPNGQMMQLRQKHIQDSHTKQDGAHCDITQ